MSREIDDVSSRGRENLSRDTLQTRLSHWLIPAQVRWISAADIARMQAAVEAQKGGGEDGDGLGGGLGGQRTEPPQVEQLLHLQNCRASVAKCASHEQQGRARNAEHATQRRAQRRQVEPMHGCGLWRTVQCCACSLSALHQLLHCSMELSCGFAGLQLTGADLGEAELRAWVPMSMASPQAARNVKAGA